MDLVTNSHSSSHENSTQADTKLSIYTCCYLSTPNNKPNDLSTVTHNSPIEIIIIIAFNILPHTPARCLVGEQIEWPVSQPPINGNCQAGGSTNMGGKLKAPWFVRAKEDKATRRRTAFIDSHLTLTFDRMGSTNSVH